MKQMLCLFMTLLFQQLHAQAKQLADLEIDGKMHQRWYLCKDMSVLLKPSEAEISDKCYKWYGKPFQGVYAFIKNSYSLNCTPNVTYFYKCERYPDETCGSGTPEAVWYFKVLVIEGIKIWYLGLNNEVMMDQKSNPPFTAPDIETMDEYSDYVIQGDLVGVNLGDFDLRDSIVSLSLTTDIGQIIPGAKMPARTSQFGYKGIIPQVQQDGISKQYNLKIQAKICNFESNVIDISVKRLWIEKFKNQFSKSNWYIVVGDPIIYKTQAIKELTNFKWYFPKKWGEPENNDKVEGNDMWINPWNQSLTPLENDDYGSRYGTIVVECKNRRGIKLSVSSAPIFDINLNAGLLKFKIRMRFMGTDQARLFYHKYGPYGNPSSIIPNWFHFWAVNRLAYNINAYQEVNWDFQVPGKFAKTEIHYGNQLLSRLTLYNLCSTKNKITINNAEGIHCFNSTMWHEFKHLSMANDFWPNGYDYLGNPPTNDKDRDLYPDDWESDSNGGQKFKFNIGPDDRIPWEMGTSGYDYEENSCHEVEKFKYQNGECNDFDLMDWSYDRGVNVQFIFQGKQWK